MERHLLHEVQAHHHHARDPEEDDVEAGDQRRRRVIALELRRLVGPAERRERPQRGGEPGVEHVLVARERRLLSVVLVGRRSAPRLRSPRRKPCRPARTRPESGGPTRAGARCTRAGCSPSSRNRSSPSSSGRIWSGRRAPPRSPASPASWRRHTTGRSGTARSPRSSGRRAAPMCACGSIFSTRPISSSRARISLRAAKRSVPCIASVASSSADVGTPATKSALSFRLKLGLDVEDIDQRQVMPLADLEVVEVVRGRDLHRARALLGIGIVVGDDRDAGGRPAAGSRSCRSGACSARRPDAPRPRCRRASSPAASSRRR